MKKVKQSGECAVKRTKSSGMVALSVIIAIVLISAGVLLCVNNVSVTVASGESQEFVNYSLVDDFTEWNAGNWTKKDSKGVINFNSNVTFINDRASEAEGYEGAKLISNVKFLSGKDTFFDMSFSPYVTNNYKGSSDPAEVAKSTEFIRLNRKMSMGVMFGMKSQSDTLAHANYFRINPPFIDVFCKGEKLTAKYAIAPDFGSYMDHDDPNSMRLVAKKGGTLEIYIGNRFYNINEPFAIYEGLDFDGFTAFTTNSYNIDSIDLPLSFKNIALTGNTVKDMDNFDVLRVKLETVNLVNAVVSNKPLILSSKVTSKPNLVDYHEVKYTVSGAGAEIDGNNLIIKSAEMFKVKVTSKYNQRIIDEFTVVPKVLEISNIAIKKDNLNNLTIFSQPVQLSTLITSNYSHIRELNLVDYRVVSGNAEIITYYSVTSDTYLSQLKITGAGKVLLRSTSTVLEDKFDEVTINVTDPDSKKSGGCGGAAGAAAGLVAMAAVMFIIKRR